MVGSPPLPSGHSMKETNAWSPTNCCNRNTRAFAISNALVTGGRLDSIGRSRGERAYDTGMHGTAISPIPHVAAGDHDALADALATRGACRILGLPDAT